MFKLGQSIAHYFRPRPKSADIAAERLKIILAHERRGVNAPLIEQMKEEIIQVVSKFIEVDNDNIDAMFHLKAACFCTNLIKPCTRRIIDI